LPSTLVNFLYNANLQKGISADPNYYRPIALTATMSKRMNSVRKDQMAQFLVDKDLKQQTYQHAFIKSHSIVFLTCLNVKETGQFASIPVLKTDVTVYILILQSI
jgi:hypothetical protein